MYGMSLWSNLSVKETQFLFPFTENGNGSTHFFVLSRYNSRNSKVITQAVKLLCIGAAWRKKIRKRAGGAGGGCNDVIHSLG